MRDLSIRIDVDADKAKRALAETDAAIAKLTAEFKAGSITTQQYYEKLQTLSAAAAKAKGGTDGLSDAQNKLKPATEKSATATDLLTTKLMQYLTGAAILGAIKQTLTYASSLDAMNAATEISYKGLQQLENIAISTNTTLPALTSSVLDLQRRLATGDDSAAAAMLELGINTEKFLLLKGDEQFFTIARALGDMTDETARNRIAAWLFRLTYKEILAALVSDVDTLKDSVRLMTDAEIIHLARAEAAWQRFTLNLKRSVGEALTLKGALRFVIPGLSFDPKAAVAEMQRAMEASTKNAAASARAAAKVTEHAAALAGFIGPQMDANIVQRISAERLQAQERAQEHATRTTEKAVEAVKKLRSALLEVENVLPGLRTEIGRTDTATLESIQTTLKRAATERDYYNMVGEREIETAALKQATLNEEAAVLRAFYNDVGVRRMEDEAAAIATNGHIKQSFIDAFAQLPTLLVAAFTGGGGFLGAMKAFGVQLADALITPIIEQMSKIGKMAVGIGGSIASTIGGAVGGGGGALVGSIAGGIGGAAVGAAMGTAMTATIAGSIALGAATAGIGLAAVGAYVALKKLFTVSAEEKAARVEIGNFNADLLAMATASQQAEAAMSGWADTGLAASLIVVRDAYLAAGHSAEEAQLMMAKFWDSSHNGGKDTLALQQQINAVVVEGQKIIADRQAAALAEGDAIHAAATARLTEMGAALDVMMNRRDQLMAGIEKEAPERIMGVIESRARAELQTLDKEIANQRDLMKTVAEQAAADLERLLSAINPTVDVTVRWKIPPLPSVEAPEHHLGGVVLPFLPRAHRGLALDEVPIIAQTGEGILNRGAMRQIGGASALNRMNAGGGTSSGDSGAAIAGLRREISGLREETAGLRRDFLFEIPSVNAKALATELVKRRAS